MLVNNAIEENGDGLIGVVLGVDNIKDTSESLKKQGFAITDISNGEGHNNVTQESRKWKNFFLPQELSRGIFSFVIEHTEGSLKEPDEYSSYAINKLDHLVINTNDANGFINIYQDIFKIRLALDKVIEHWDSRMLFFRLNKTTIEVVEKKDEKDVWSVWTSSEWSEKDTPADITGFKKVTYNGDWEEYQQDKK